jgi:hypothetical protein
MENSDILAGLQTKHRKNKTNLVKTNSEFRLLKKESIGPKAETLKPSTLLKPL